MFQLHCNNLLLQEMFSILLLSVSHGVPLTLPILTGLFTSCIGTRLKFIQLKTTTHIVSIYGMLSKVFVCTYLYMQLFLMISCFCHYYFQWFWKHCSVFLCELWFWVTNFAWKTWIPQSKIWQTQSPKMPNSLLQFNLKTFKIDLPKAIPANIPRLQNLRETKSQMKN